MLAAHIFARWFFYQRHGRLKVLVVLVQTFHPVGHPAGAGFKKSDFQPRIKLQNAAADDAHDTNHLLECMGSRVDKKCVIEAISGSRRPTGTDVNADWNAQFLSLGVKRIETGMIEIASG